MKVPRRTVLKGLLTLPLTGCLSQASESEETQKAPDPNDMLLRTIPSSQEPIPAVGLGTYEAFGEFGSNEQQERLTKVLALFAQAGGRVIDTSPMYSQAEDVLGTLLPKAQAPKGGWFLATKVWTDGQAQGKEQIAASKSKLGVKKLELNQIHNMRDWKVHLESLKLEKASGHLRYIGATTWGGLDHEKLETVMKTGELDFIQVTYNITHRAVEERILPLADELGIAVIANRPFSKASLFSRVKGKDVPEWLKVEVGCQTWAQVFLKFVLSDPRVTVVIPATSKPKHLIDNMQAGSGPLLDSVQRKKLVHVFE